MSRLRTDLRPIAIFLEPNGDGLWAVVLVEKDGEPDPVYAHPALGKHWRRRLPACDSVPRRPGLHGGPQVKHASDAQPAQSLAALIADLSRAEQDPAFDGGPASPIANCHEVASSIAEIEKTWGVDEGWWEVCGGGGLGKVLVGHADECVLLRGLFPAVASAAWLAATCGIPRGRPGWEGCHTSMLMARCWWEGEKGPIRSPPVPWLACLTGLEGRRSMKALGVIDRAE